MQGGGAVAEEATGVGAAADGPYGDADTDIMSQVSFFMDAQDDAEFIAMLRARTDTVIQADFPPEADLRPHEHDRAAEVRVPAGGVGYSSRPL